MSNTHDSSRNAMPTNREILGLAVPALGTLAAEPLMGLLDTALVGHLGSTELAALGAANALLAMVFAILVFIEYGTTARLARLLGARRLGPLAHEAVQMGWIACGLGVLVTLAIYGLRHPLLVIVDAPPEIVDIAATYLAIRSLGALPGLWVRLGNGVFRGLQDTKTPLVIVIAMNVLNAVLDVLLIFGWSAVGIPAFGIVGAASATVIANWLGGLAFLWILRRRLHDALVSSPGGIWPRWDILRDMLGMSRDLMLRTLGLMAALFMGTRMAATVGTVALAAHQVGWQLWIFLALALDSLAIAGQALVGRLIGAGRADIARRVGNKLCCWGLWLGIGFCITFLLLRNVLPRIFSDDPTVLAAVGSVFLLLSLMQIPNAIVFVIDGLLIGASDMAFLRNAMMALGLFGVAATWVAGTLGGTLFWVWVGLSAYMFARLAVMWMRWAGGRWAGAADDSSSH